jgi:hypothetical protein
MEEKGSRILDYRPPASPMASRQPKPRSVWRISVNIGLWWTAMGAIICGLLLQLIQSGRIITVFFFPVVIIWAWHGIRPLLRERREAIVRERHLCPTCGTFLLSESFRFCPSCGKALPGRNMLDSSGDA